MPLNDTTPSPRVKTERGNVRPVASKPIPPVSRWSETGRRKPGLFPRLAKTPVWLIMLSGALGGLVLLCAACSFALVLVGPDRVLALRDQLLGVSPEQRIAAIGEIIEAVVSGETAWPLPGEQRLTILLMGADRRTGEQNAPTRSDAITLVTIDPKSNTAAMLSIPRDLYVPLAGLDRVDRINTAYFFGDVNKAPGGGGQVAKDTIEYNFGIPVHRHFVINFEGFRKAIDAVGGIDINVPRTIVDNLYPTEDYGYEQLVIEAGPTHMDGELALKYVRTRHQDSDFGRLQRQQQVMLAVREKALNPDILGKLPELLDAATGSYETDLSVAEMISIFKVWNEIPDANIKTYRIDESMAQFWTTPSGASVLIPQRELITPVVEAFLGQSPAVGEQVP